ncbi:MAG TPA: hypothetical protein PLY16_03120 [Candidatus Saccharibacteria bacterium]|nr:hypothetical protein [Candidatus Saccharibacteria bacterium]
MTIFDKNWALNQLRHQRNSYFVGLAAMHLLNHDAILGLVDTIVMIKDDYIIFNPSEDERKDKRYELHLKQLVDDYINKPDDLFITLVEFHKFIRRNLIKECFEVAKSYSKFMGIGKTLTVQPWYHWARIVRNAITHDLHFVFNKSDHNILPITWCGKTIDLPMNGMPFTQDFLGPELTIQLIVEIHDFILSH